MNTEITYLNNAATSWPKPNCVKKSVTEYFDEPPVNSARHCNCIKKDTDVDILCKRKIAEFFNVDTEKYDITITGGATYSANIVINWISTFLSKYKLVTDNMQHNSIYRTHFEKIKTKPVIVKDLSTWKYDYCNNYYVAITQVGNVDGTLFTNDKIFSVIEQCKKGNFPLILDITQSAGSHMINLSLYDYDNMYVICSGHKGLFSTTGIGFLISPKGKIDVPFISGGTGGVQGIDYEHTGSLEAGTPNELAMTSLISGIEFIEKTGIDNIKLWKESLVERFFEKFDVTKCPCFNDNFELVPCTNPSSGIICFKMKNKDKCKVFVEKMVKDYSIIVRTGVHCAPLYHINVLKCESTLRISFGFFNTFQNVDYLLNSICNIFV